MPSDWVGQKRAFCSRFKLRDAAGTLAGSQADAVRDEDRRPLRARIGRAACARS